MKFFNLHFKRYFFTGLAAILPLFLTVIILYLLFGWISGFTAPLLKPLFIMWFNTESVLLLRTSGFVLTLIIIWLVGVLTAKFINRKLLFWVEAILDKLPVFNVVYSSIRKLTNFMFGRHLREFKGVAIVEYPMPGSYAFAFVTGVGKVGPLGNMVRVFIPTTPNPTTGFFLFLPEKRVKSVDISFDEALSMLVSAGIVVPENFSERVRDGLIKEPNK